MWSVACWGSPTVHRRNIDRTLYSPGGNTAISEHNRTGQIGNTPLPPNKANWETTRHCEGSEIGPPPLLGPLCELLSPSQLHPLQHKLHPQQVVDRLQQQHHQQPRLLQVPGVSQFLSRVYNHVRPEQPELQHLAQAYSSHESKELAAQTTTEKERTQKFLVPCIQFGGSWWSGGSCRDQ